MSSISNTTSKLIFLMRNKQEDFNAKLYIFLLYFSDNHYIYICMLTEASLKQRIDKAMCMKITGV